MLTFGCKSSLQEYVKEKESLPIHEHAY